MIKVIVGTNTNRRSVMVDPSRTLKSVLEENGVDYSRGGIHLDGLAVGGEGTTEHSLNMGSQKIAFSSL